MTPVFHISTSLSCHLYIPLSLFYFHLSVLYMHTHPYMYMHIYIYTHRDTHISTFVHINILIYKYINTLIYKHTHTHINFTNLESTYIVFIKEGKYHISCPCSWGCVYLWSLHISLPVMYSEKLPLTPMIGIILCKQMLPSVLHFISVNKA